MLMATPLNEEQYEFANIVKRSSRILMDLLNDFLDFDRYLSSMSHLSFCAFPSLSTY